MLAVNGVYIAFKISSRFEIRTTRKGKEDGSYKNPILKFRLDFPSDIPLAHFPIFIFCKGSRTVLLMMKRIKMPIS